MPRSRWIIRVLVLALPHCATTGVEAAQRAGVTFARDVAPLLYRHCVVCHRPGGAAQVSFLTYADARPHARQIAAMTAARTMTLSKSIRIRDVRISPEISLFNLFNANPVLSQTTAYPNVDTPLRILDGRLLRFQAQVRF